MGVWTKEGTSSQARSLPQFPPPPRAQPPGLENLGGRCTAWAGLRVRTGGRGAGWEPAALGKGADPGAELW